MKKRCERNIAGREEDTAAGVAYTPCGKPATHVVRQRGHEEWAACDEHAAEAESDESDIIAAGRRVPFPRVGMIVHPDDCVNCERGGHPLWCSPIVSDIRDDERWGMTATLLYRTGEVREEPCQELRRRWRLAGDFDR